MWEKLQNKQLKVKAIAASVFFISFLGLGDMAANVALAQSEMFIYPKQGQSPEQQEKDKFECYSWAKQQSGFDPMEVPRATAPPPAKEEPKGGALRGAVGGAALGAVVGGIAGDAGKGAAIGAGAGGLFGGMRRQKQVASQDQAEKQWAQEQGAQYTEKRNAYNRAYTACLEARDYTVK